MSQKSRVVLKTKFEAGRIPTEKDFGDVLDSTVNKTDDHISVRSIDDGDQPARYVGFGSVAPESPVSIRNRSGSDHLLGLENKDGEEEWRIEINPGKENKGINIQQAGDQNTDSNLFIQRGGNIGIGTKTPAARLDVNGNTNIIGRIKIADGTQAEGRILTCDKNGAAVWKNPPVPEGIGRGDILYWGGGSMQILKAGKDGESLTMVNGIPRWVSMRPTISVTPAKLVFSNISSLDATLLIENTGQGLLTISSIVITNTAFVAETPSLLQGFQIPPLGKQYLKIKYTGSTTENGFVTINSNDSSNLSLKVPLEAAYIEQSISYDYSGTGGIGDIGGGGGY